MIIGFAIIAVYIWFGAAYSFRRAAVLRSPRLDPDRLCSARCRACVDTDRGHVMYLATLPPAVGALCLMMAGLSWPVALSRVCPCVRSAVVDHRD